MGVFKNLNDIAPLVVGEPLDAPLVLGQGPVPPEVMLVKAAPTSAEVKGGKPFLGRDGLAVRKALFEADIEYYATNAFPFFTGKAKVTAAQARPFLGVLAEEINLVDPPKVVLFGSDAAKWCVPFGVPFRKFSDVLGRTFDVGGRMWYVAPSTMQLSNSPSHYREFVRAMGEFLALTPAEFKEAQAETDEGRYTVVTNAAIARVVLRDMPKRVAVDVETDGLDFNTCKLLTIQFSWEEGRGFAFPWEVLPPSEWASILAGRELVFQNGTFDVKVLAANGVHVRIAEDTMLMHSLVDETPGSHSMRDMARKMLGMEKWEELVDYENMAEVPLQTLGEYGARDTDLTLRLANVMKPLVKNRPIYKFLHDAQNAITQSEVRGVRVDRDAALEMHHEVERHLAASLELLQREWKLANPNSPKQVLEALLGLGVPLRKVKGSYSTAEESIAPFAEEYPVIGEILNYRHLTKVGSTYLANLLSATEATGRYHGSYRLAATETGRVAERFLTLVPRTVPGDNPSVGRQYQSRLRELFIPDPGMVMVGADYSGLELAMAGELSLDPKLIEDINLGRDTHSLLAIEAFGLPVDVEPMGTLKRRMNELHPHERTLAKQLCVPLDSQALTRGGWKHYHELSVGDDVLTYNQDRNVCEWQPILAKVLYDDSPVVEMRHGHKWSVRCTPNHRWYGEVRRGTGGKREYVPTVFTAETMTSEHRFTVSAPAEGGGSPITPQEAAVIAWVITDGTHRWAKGGLGGSQGSDGQRRHVSARILQKKPETCEVIDRLLEGVPHSAGDASNGCRYWELSSPWFREVWSKAGLDADCPDYEAFVLSLSRPARQAFLEAVWQAEGYTAAYGVRVLTQNEGSEQRAMHLAAFLEGHDVRVQWSRDPRGSAEHAKMRLRSRPYVNASRVVTTELPDEPVWCIQTPNQTWVMKQGDTMTITGNTFGFLFGSSGLSMTKFMSLEAAERLIGALQSRYPRLIQWQEEVRRQARSGVVETPWGRRRHFYYHRGLSEQVLAAQDRECINFPIQGHSSDMTLVAFSRLWGMGYQTLFPVHDAIYLQVPEGQAEESVRTVQEVMENVITGVVTFRSEAGFGSSWAEV